MLRVASSFAICLIITPLVIGKDYYVSPRGKDTADGIKARPIRSIHSAASRLLAGDTIILRGGRYAEPVTVNGLGGSRDKPITITSYTGEKVIFDGTDLLDGKWNRVTPDSPEGKLIQKAQLRIPSMFT